MGTGSRRESVDCSGSKYTVRKPAVTTDKSFISGAVSCREAGRGWRVRLRAEIQKTEVRLQSCSAQSVDLVGRVGEKGYVSGGELASTLSAWSQAELGRGLSGELECPRPPGGS